MGFSVAQELSQALYHTIANIEATEAIEIANPSSFLARGDPGYAKYRGRQWGAAVQRVDRK